MHTTVHCPLLHHIVLVFYQNGPDGLDPTEPNRTVPIAAISRNCSAFFSVSSMCEHSVSHTCSACASRTFTTSAARLQEQYSTLSTVHSFIVEPSNKQLVTVVWLHFTSNSFQKLYHLTAWFWTSAFWSSSNLRTILTTWKIQHHQFIVNTVYTKPTMSFCPENLRTWSINGVIVKHSSVNMHCNVTPCYAMP